MKNRFVIQENPLSSYNVYRTIAKVYIVLAIFSSIVYFPIALDSLYSSDLADIYEMAHEEKEGNLFSKFTNLFFHVRYLGMVLFFSFLAKEKQSKIFLLLNDERYLAKICEANIDNCCLNNYSSDFDLLYCGDCKPL